MSRRLVTHIFVIIYLFIGLLIMSSVNGFTNAKWFDGGIDLIYGLVIIYISTSLYYSYKYNKNKNILYVMIGFILIVLERVLQIFLQEIDLKTNYQLAIVSWGWIVIDVVMVIGFLMIIKGLWGVKND